MGSVFRKYGRVVKMGFSSHQLSEGLASWPFGPLPLGPRWPLKGSLVNPILGTTEFRVFPNKGLCTSLWNDIIVLTFTSVNLRRLYFPSQDHSLKIRNSLKLNPGWRKESELNQPKWKFKRCSWLCWFQLVSSACPSFVVFFNSSGFRY